MLKRSNDSKVGASFTESGGQRVANSFGLPSGKNYSCPGATSVCESVCYAGKLERLRPNVRKALMHNWDLLKDADYLQAFALINAMIDEFEVDCDRKGAEKLFRIHWDGDFFSDAYIGAWEWVIIEHPNTRFWVYTRNPVAAMKLKGLPNLSLYFSGDKENVGTATNMAFNGIPVAMLGENFAQAREIVGRGAMCPEQRGQIKLQGACVACGICIKGKSNVLFSITKK